MRRRSFLAAPVGVSLVPLARPAAISEQRVYAYGDGIPHTPEEYSQVLADLAKAGKADPDDYSLGGAVEKLEARMASLLGKEMAVWLPTGTLANHLAVRLLAGARRRVLVQAESHLYNDCGDCCQTLSGLNMIPLAPGKATFSLEEVERAASESVLGRVAAPIGAIQIESPVRRRRGERFDFAQMTKIAAWARERRIGLHLDGARLCLESAYTGRPLKEYAALFDTVYISVYKCFNAASGAVLAGPKALLTDLYHTRRMFGGGLPRSWPFAAMALHYLEGYEQRFRNAVETAERVIAALSADGNFEVQRIPNGTNIFLLRAASVNAPVYQLRLETAGITARAPTGVDWFTLQVNETWARLPAQEIIARFRKALG
jgi:threonine aldolase